MNALKALAGKPMLAWLEQAKSDSDYAMRFNQLSALRSGVRSELEYDSERRLFKVTEGKDAVWVARRSRLHFQIRGVAERRAKLQDEYLVPEGLVRKGDLVIDCGANIGEFAIICAKLGANVLAFEPEPEEFRALQANADFYGQITPFNLALWDSAGVLPFFNKNSTGDSSLFDPGEAEGVINISTIRLDSLDAVPAAPARIRLMKVEAEGGEPEVLSGCGDILDRVDYISADLGPERGTEKLTTVAEVTDLLYARGFKMLKFFEGRCTALFGSREVVGG